MDDAGIMARVSALIEQEHQLRARLTRGELDEASEHEQLRAAEVELDQCWDLLRQRRARLAAGQSTDEATSRPESVVENYWQ
jgi:uncharacterized membrane protein YccC